MYNHRRILLVVWTWTFSVGIHISNICISFMIPYNGVAPIQERHIFHETTRDLIRWFRGSGWLARRTQLLSIHMLHQSCMKSRVHRCGVLRGHSAWLKGRTPLIWGLLVTSYHSGVGYARGTGHLGEISLCPKSKMNMRNKRQFVA